MTLSCKGRLVDLSVPQVMGILNVTPDSFFDGGRHVLMDNLLRQTEKMLRDGATFIDVGGASSRPGAASVPVAAELERILPALEAILQRFPQALISIDTWRAAVAREAVAVGAAMVNDISAGNMDAAMLDTVAQLQTPYILMHMQGAPGTMQQNPKYGNVVTEVLDFFIEKVAQLKDRGIEDIVIDPGFGFGKTLEHNFALLKHIHVFREVLGLPVLVGLSRKSMICKALGVNPAAALNGTTALHMVALQQGASLLRAHDVQEAMQAITLWQLSR